MSLVRGLKSIKKHQDEQEARFSSSTRFFRLKDREAAKIVFLQELDEDSPNYSGKNGLGAIAVEHSSPKNFRNKALCTSHDGACWACEQLAKEGWKSGWKAKDRLYINVLVDNGVDDPYVAVLNQGMGPKSISPSLIEYATEVGSITDKNFKITRKGSGAMDTQYLLTPLGVHGEEVESFELFDLDEVVDLVPYEEQQAHYMTGVEAEAQSEQPERDTVKAAASSDDEW